MQPVYLDHAATTPLRDEVRAAMEPYLSDAFGNPSSLHRWGRAAAAALETARERLAAALGCPPGEIRFVRGGTESDNLAVTGRAAVARAEGRRPVVAHSAVEHPAVREACRAVEAGGGRRLEIGVDADGSLDPDGLAEALAAAPDVLSVMWVNNETGTVLPVEEVAAEARARGIVLHTDAVQAVGKVPVALDRVDVDLLSLTGHKIYGPKGSGALRVRGGVALTALHHGGGQERGIRPGTQDVAGAVGLAEAVALAVEERASEAERLAGLRDRLEASLVERLGGVHLHGAEGERAPHVSALGIDGVDGDALLAGLDLEGVAASGGSACASGSTRASHVLSALHGEAVEGRAALRFSLGRSTGPAEVARAVRAAVDVVERLRAAGVRTA